MELQSYRHQITSASQNVICVLSSNNSRRIYKRIKQDYLQFLWKGTDKITRLAAVNDSKYAGLNLIDLETYVKSSRLAWLGRIFSEGSSPWKAYINCLLEDFGRVFLFSCNYDVKDCKIISTFYRDLLQWWADLSLSPDIAAFKEVINMKYKTEKYIAVKNNMQRKFQERWKLFIDS